MTFAQDAAGAKPAFDTVVRCVCEATGAKLELATLGDTGKHGEAVTGLKKVSRIVEKAALRPGEGRGRTERVCDVVRAMFVAEDMAQVAAIASALVALSNAGVVQIVRIKVCRCRTLPRTQSHTRANGFVSFVSVV